MRTSGRELTSLISALSQDEQIDLVALTWLGEMATAADWLSAARATRAQRSHRKLSWERRSWAISWRRGFRCWANPAKILRLVVCEIALDRRILAMTIQDGELDLAALRSTASESFILLQPTTTLPGDADRNGASARFAKGVLALSIAKTATPSAQVKEVAIKAA
jgi:hypothetical protein